MRFSNGKPMFSLTAEEIAELERRTERREEELRKKKLYAEFISSGLNDDSLHASFDRYNRHTEEQQQLYTYGKMMVNNRAMKALVICGKNGTGKTWTGACCIRELGGLYRKSMDICSEYDDAGKAYGKEKRSSVLARYTGVKFLVIDEVMRTAHQSEREVISYIVSERIENGRKIIILGNCSGSEILKVLDGAAMSRLQRVGTLIETKGEDQRCT